MRGAIPLPLLGLLAGVGMLILFSITPTGQAVIKTALNIGASLLDIGQQLLSMTITLFSVMIALTKVSFGTIHTISGLLLFIIVMIFWAIAGFGIISVTAWILEKIRNIIKP